MMWYANVSYDTNVCLNRELNLIIYISIFIFYNFVQHNLGVYFAPSPCDSIWFESIASLAINSHISQLI